MNHLIQRVQQKLPWFSIGMLSLFLISFFLRFWGLSRFNTLVFDEVYYAKFGNNYLTNTPFFNSHPPVSQYLIAFGIWLGSRLPFGQDTVNNLAGSVLTPWSYRWLNALFGSFIPFVLGAIAYQLTHRRSYTLIVTFLMAMDGLFLVESRYALSNIYIVIFGLLGQLFFLTALQPDFIFSFSGIDSKFRRWFWLSLSGILFGLTAASKWNGLGFLLGIYGLIILGFLIKYLTVKSAEQDLESQGFKSPLEHLTHLTPIQLIVSLILVPILVYFIAWLPHLQQNPDPGLWGVQQKIWEYHQTLGDGAKVHPYCSKWYSWILMLRPVAYFFKKVDATTKPDPTLPEINPEQLPVTFAVHAMGNPFLWWFSTLASVLLCLMFLQHIWVWLTGRFPQLKPQLSIQFPPRSELWLTAFLTLNWLANLLPWVKVSRCLFIYHYMTGFVFSCMALAWWIERWLFSYQPEFRWMGGTVIFLILFGFLYWMPLYLGLPLSPWEWQMRMWLPSWI